MELRLVVAYALTAFMVLGLIGWGLVYRSKQVKRRRRLRGIKTDEIADARRRRA